MIHYGLFVVKNYFLFLICVNLCELFTITILLIQIETINQNYVGYPP